MISAEKFARQNGVWHRSTPTMENYMRWLNRNVRDLGGAVPSTSDPSRHSLISEAAFRLLFNFAETAEAEARDFVSGLPRGESAMGRLSPDELREAGQLRALTAKYLSRERRCPTATFQPAFPGCGVVEAARGDILLGRELIEIKAVQRSFRSTDLRQVITYSAMDYSATGRRVENLTLLNPGQGTYFSADVEGLAMDIGAGSWVELLKDIVDAMTGLEISL